MSKGFDIICGTIKHRILNENKAAMILIVGEMGSGKSLAGVSMACKIDPSWKNHKTIVYTSEEFLTAIDNAKKGQVIIWDEVGVGVPAREWQKAQNKMISILMQILRYKNVCVIFTTPNIRFIDINLRESMNYMIRPKKILRDVNVNECKLFSLYTTNMGEVAYGSFKYFDGSNGNGEVIDPLYIPRPEPEIEAFYEELSINKKNSIIKELRASIEGEAAPDPATVYATERKAEVCTKLITYFKDKYSWNEIEAAAGMNKRTLQMWLKEPVKT